jgi:hypothetical protein
MEESAYIGGLIAGFAFLIAGIRLYRLQVRTGEAPERLLATTFLVWSLSYFCWQLPVAVETGSLAAPLLFIGNTTNELGCITFALFLRVVFRNQERWATWLVVAVAVTLTTGVVGSWWVGDSEGLRPLTNPWWWLQIAGDSAVFAWTGVEGFIQYRKARQRLRLGLCEPMVCNRYLLWGLTGVVWTVYEFAVVVHEIEYAVTQVWSASMDFVVAGLELAAIALIWLVFFPPAIYQRWIDRAGSSATVGEG